MGSQANLERRRTERVLTDRTIVHTIHADDGTVEIYWARARDDFPDTLPNFTGYNSILLHADGALSWRGWTDDDRPISVTILDNAVTVAESEDVHVLSGEGIVFDSRAIPNRLDN